MSIDVFDYQLWNNIMAQPKSPFKAVGDIEYLQILSKTTLTLNIHKQTNKIISPENFIQNINYHFHIFCAFYSISQTNTREIQINESFEQ